MDIRFAANGTNWGRPAGWSADELDSWRWYLDEISAAGFDGIEHTMPLTPIIEIDTVGAELGQRGLKLAGLALFGPLETAEGRKSLVDQVDAAAQIVTAIGADYLYVIDALVPDAGGDPASLDAESWAYLVETAQILNQRSLERCGAPVLLHPHEFSHVDGLDQVERFLRDTEHAGVQLLFDAGHCAYRGGDPAAFYAQHHDRISQIHLKNLDRNRIPDPLPARMADLASTGAFADLTTGDLDFGSFRDALNDHAYRGWITIEMLRFPPEPDRSLDMARNALDHLRRMDIAERVWNQK